MPSRIAEAMTVIIEKYADRAFDETLCEMPPELAEVARLNPIYRDVFKWGFACGVASGKAFTDAAAKAVSDSN